MRRTLSIYLATCLACLCAPLLAPVLVRAEDPGTTYQEVLDFLCPADDGSVGTKKSEKDPHALRKFVGLPPIDPEKAERRSLYRDPPGSGLQLDLHVAEGPGYRAIAVSRMLRSTQVLLFRKQGDSYRFSHALQEILGDFGNVTFLEPVPQTLLLEVQYRIGSGTGCSFSGRSLFLIRKNRSKLLLSDSPVGYMDGPAEANGYRVLLGDLTKTWPDLRFSCTIEEYRNQKPATPGGKPAWSKRSAITETLIFTWNESREDFRYRKGNRLSKEQALRLLAHPDRFLREQIAARSLLVKRLTVAVPYPFAYGK